MKFSHRSLILLSSALWLSIGIFLLSKGLNFIVLSSQMPELSGFLMHKATSFFPENREKAALFLIATALLVGFIKGRFVLSKTVKRVIARIASLPNPAPLSQLYSFRYYLIIVGMMGLAMLLKWLPIGVDMRGWVDVAVGSALINGATLYFRLALTYGKQIPS